MDHDTDMTAAHDHGDTENMVITDNNAFLMAMGEGSRIEIHAADAAKESWTELHTTAAAGTNVLEVQEHTGWEVGDKIAITSSTSDSNGSEEFTILGISDDGKSITLDGDLQFSHDAQVKTYDNGQDGDDYREWTVETSAEVGLLSRNVTIQGDEDSVEDGFGAHTMVMDGAEQHISGAEFFRVGQEDILGRYPIHWHMLGDAEGQYVENVSVHESYQKGSTIHGTSNIRYEENVIYDNVGHGVFFEDGSENENLVLGNLVFGTAASDTGTPTIPTDETHASSFWIENPNNVFIGNVAGGSDSNGFWIVPAENPHGLSASTFVGEAGEMSDLVFIGNEAHSNGNIGLAIDGQIRTQLNFSTKIIEADFAVIEDFTAYDNGSVGLWAMSYDLVINDSAFVDNDFNLWLRGEDIVADTVIVDTDDDDNIDGTTRVYRDGETQFDGVHFEGLSGPAIQWSDHSLGANVVNNVTSSDENGNAADPRLSFIREDVTNNEALFYDVDGSVTGVAGTFVTPDNSRTQENLFDTAPDAVYVDNAEGWVTEATIGTAQITMDSLDRNLTIQRSDGLARDDYPPVRDWWYEYNVVTDMDRDMAYLLDFDVVPQSMTIDISGVGVGDSVIYELPDVAEDVETVNGGVAVTSLETLLASNETAYFADSASGNVFVRLVAEPGETIGTDTVTDYLADYRAEATFEITFTGEIDNSNEYGTRTLSDDLLDLIGPTSSSEPIAAATDSDSLFVDVGDANDSYIGYDLKMTEAQSDPDSIDTLSDASFEVNYDVSTSTVSIIGEFSDLTSDITQIHLHSGAVGENGGVISNLTFDTNDGVNGTFEGSFTLSSAEAEQFLGGDTYVNLHTVDNPSGELRGQIEVNGAGDFVLERSESTSDTTVVTDDMARWTDEATWDGNGVPGIDDVIVINEGRTVVLNDSAFVKGIIVNGGELIIEDGEDLDIQLSTDYLLVINGGLFQAGTEDDPLDTDFTLTLEGDDPEFDLLVGEYVLGNMPNTVFASAEAASPTEHHDDGTDDTEEAGHDHGTDDTEEAGHDHGTDDAEEVDHNDGTDDTEEAGHDHGTEEGDADSAGDDYDYDTDILTDEIEDDDIDNDTSDEEADEAVDDDNAETDEGVGDDSAIEETAEPVEVLSLTLMDSQTGSDHGGISDGATLGSGLIDNDGIVIAADWDINFGSLVIRVDDYVQVFNASGTDDDTFELDLPDEALFQPGETVAIEVVAFSEPDAAGEVLGEAGYTIAVPDEEEDDDDDGGSMMGQIMNQIADLIASLFGGGGGDDKDSQDPAVFEESDVLLTDLIPALDIEDGVAHVDEEDFELDFA